ncbi:diguanylate cyclase domain-containing protein, partial [Salmonella enterica]|uniref:diguanylate cyclase domain-containing protein n=1 Tax=Salmonella enterica TaxID=28901 RepID=UPI003FA78943
RDLTETVAAQKRIEELAFTDALTGLPNRVMLAERVEFAIAMAQRHHAPVALLFIDLDRFKLVNDTLGHGSGDRLLMMAADRLQQCLRADDAAGRLGGDEFAFVLANLARADDAALVAQKVVATLARPYLLDGQEI